MLNLDEHTITQEVLNRLESTPDPRLKQIMRSLVTHLHDFARDVSLTEEEWLRGVLFLTRTGQISDAVRQEMILLSDTLGLSQLVVAQNHSRPKQATEQTVFGPFHVENPPVCADGADIGTGSVGEPLWVSARVVDQQSKPVAGAAIDVWQADAEGFYDVQDENWSMENARLRAAFTTDTEGAFRFRSVMPKSYPIPTDGTVGEMMRATARHAMRPAHVHFRIRKPGFDPVITHIFVDGDEYLDSDAVFGVRSSCIGTYVHHDGGKAPDGTPVQGPFHTLEYTFNLHPLA